MKLLKQILLLFFGLLFNLSLVPADPAVDTSELKKFAAQLIDALDPNMSQEEKQKLVDTTVQETIQMDNYLKSLPESERLEKEKEIEEAVSYLMSSESPLKGLFEEKQQPIAEQPEMIDEEVVEEEKPIKDEDVTPLGDVKDIKNVLDSIICRIGSLLVKAKSMPRVSSDKNTENKWNKLRPSLSATESLLRIITKKNKLLNILLGKDYKSLHNNLTNLKGKLEKEVKFKVPDTAGLTIIYEDDDEDNVEFVTAQKQLQDIIVNLYKIFEQGMIKQLRDFIEKNAPEEFQKNPEILKNIESIEKKHPDFYSGSGHSVGSGLGSGLGLGGYPSFSSGSSSSGFGSGPTSGDSKLSSPSSSGAADKKGGAGKKGLRFGDDSEQRVGESKKKREKTNKKDLKHSDETQISELETALENVSGYLIQTDIPGIANQLRKSKSVGTIDLRSFQVNFNELERSYDKAIKIATKLNASIKLLPQEKQKKLKNLIKTAYSNPKLQLETSYDYIKEELNDIHEVNLPQENIKRIQELIKSHDKLREIVDVKKIDAMKELKDSINSLSESLNSIDIPGTAKQLSGDVSSEKNKAILENFNKKLEQIDKNYNNSIKYARHIRNFTKKLRNEKKNKYIDKIHKLYRNEDLKLEQHYENIVKALKNVGSSSLSKQNFEKLNKIVVKHTKLKKLTRKEAETKKKLSEEKETEEEI